MGEEREPIDRTSFSADQPADSTGKGSNGPVDAMMVENYFFDDF